MNSTVSSVLAPNKKILPAEELVYQLKLNNEQAYFYLYEAYSSALYNSIKKIVKCPLTAEDILQNVFIKIWLNIASYSSGKGSLFTWMNTIAKHAVISYLRSKHAKRSTLTFLWVNEPTQEMVVVAPSIVRLEVLNSLKLISPAERTIIELYSQGFSSKEIAGLLCLPQGTVKTKIRAAYKKLRALLS